MKQYESSEFVSKFKKTQLCSRLIEDYDILLYRYNDTGVLYYDNNKLYRYKRGYFDRNYQSVKKINIDIFYYIEYVILNNTDVVYDIGCGTNFLKKYYNNIIGIDPEHPNADIHSYLDSEFSEKYKNTADGLIAINSLHFSDIKNLYKNIDCVINILKTKGRAFITFNLLVLQEESKESDIKKLFKQLIKILNTYNEVVLIDTFDYRMQDQASENGSIRILLEKK